MIFHKIVLALLKLFLENTRFVREKIDLIKKIKYVLINFYTISIK